MDCKSVYTGSIPVLASIFLDVLGFLAVLGHVVLEVPLS